MASYCRLSFSACSRPSCSRPLRCKNYYKYILRAECHSCNATDDLTAVKNRTETMSCIQNDRATRSSPNKTVLLARQAASAVRLILYTSVTFFLFFLSFFFNDLLEQVDLENYKTDLHQIFRAGRRVGVDVQSGIGFQIGQGMLHGNQF